MSMLPQKVLKNILTYFMTSFTVHLKKCQVTMQLLLGDLSAKLGKGNLYKNIFVFYRLPDETSNNKTRAGQFATANNLVAVSNGSLTKIYIK